MYDVFTYLPAACSATRCRPAAVRRIRYRYVCADKLPLPHGVPTKQDMMGAAPRASRSSRFFEVTALDRAAGGPATCTLLQGMAPLPGFGATGPCWKCRGSGVVAAGRRKRAAGATDLCRVCGGSGALRRGRQRSTEPGRVTQPRSSVDAPRTARRAWVSRGRERSSAVCVEVGASSSGLEVIATRPRTSSRRTSPRKSP